MNIQLPKPIGRPSHNIKYTNVHYNNKEYTVGKVPFKDTYLKFVINRADFDKIDGYSWHKSSNNYISQGVIVDGKKKEFYLHNLILNIFDFPGKGSKESIDHISRNGLDNRKENLRLVTQSAQNINQKQKERSIELPADSGVTVDEIPKHVWYIKSNGSHGERFGIDLKTENVKWKSTSAKNVSLQDKLKAAKEQLQIYYQQFPYLNPNNEDKNKEIEELAKSYEEIVGLVE
jgi:hypothetical protein